MGPSRQTLLFSATMPAALAEFARAGLRNPELIRLDADTKVSPDLGLAFFTVRCVCGVSGVSGRKAQRSGTAAQVRERSTCGLSGRGMLKLLWPRQALWPRDLLWVCE